MNVNFGASCCALKFGKAPEKKAQQPKQQPAAQVNLNQPQGDSVKFSGCCG